MKDNVLSVDQLEFQEDVPAMEIKEKERFISKENENLKESDQLKNITFSGDGGTLEEGFPDMEIVPKKKSIKKKKYGPYKNKKPEKIKCDLCDYIGYISNVKIHKISAHEGKLFQCDQCTSSFKNLATVRDHVKKKHENLSFPCQYCPDKLSSNHHLKIHIKWKHLGIMKQCDECGYEVGTKNGLAEHKNFRHKEKTFLCIDGCSFIGSTPASLKQHQKSKIHS